MRIIDYNRPAPLDAVTILLDETEVSQLISHLEHLLEDPADHIHLTSEDFQTEITIARFDTPRPELMDQKTQSYI